METVRRQADGIGSLLLLSKGGCEQGATILWGWRVSEFQPHCLRTRSLASGTVERNSCFAGRGCRRAGGGVDQSTIALFQGRAPHLIPSRSKQEFRPTARDETGVSSRDA